MAETVYKATVQYAGDEFFIGTTPSGHAQAIDTNADRKSAQTPLEMLLVSVAACTAADVVSILEKKRQKISAYRVEIEGDRRE
ncbi:MAG: OsmC family protein, partial [Acidimicrobiales bacterium]